MTSLIFLGRRELMSLLLELAETAQASHGEEVKGYHTELGSVSR